MLIIFFFISLILYTLAIALFILGLSRQEPPRSDLQPLVSVVIPVKNEKEHIQRILTELIHQTYPMDRYEVIVVDDESTDITPNICSALVKKYDNFHLLSTEGMSSPLKYKKRPLDLGIGQAKGEIILLTDADCHVVSTWIEAMASYFAPQVGLVIGYSQTGPAPTRLQKIQAVDFLMLMAAARGTTQLGFPLACSGQNLAYRKRAFKEVGGFSSFARAVGGDDNLLLQKVKHETDWKIVFATDSLSHVTTPPVPTLKGFISQRARWASDALYIQKLDRPFFAMILTTFLVNLFLVFLGITLPWKPEHLTYLGQGIAIKFALEGILMIQATRLFRRHELRATFAGWFVFQVPYVVLMGILTLAAKRLGWGGRPK